MPVCYILSMPTFVEVFTLVNKIHIICQGSMIYLVYVISAIHSIFKNQKKGESSN